MPNVILYPLQASPYVSSSSHNFQFHHLTKLTCDAIQIISFHKYIFTKKLKYTHTHKHDMIDNLILIHPEKKQLGWNPKTHCQYCERWTINKFGDNDI